MSDVIEIVVPKENPNDEFAILLEWKFSPGHMVEKDALVAVVESSKAVYDIHAPVKGFLFYRREVGEKVPFGEPLAYISKDQDFSFPEARPASEVSKSRGASFTRKARKLMERNQISESAFTGMKRVKEEDVVRYMEDRVSHGVATPSLPMVGEIRPLSANKLFEIELLRKSSETVIYSNAVRQFPFSRIKEALDKKAGDGALASLGALMVSASARCLPEFEYLNACYVDNQAHLYKRINVGVAMNLGKGLKVPVLCDADQMSLTELNDSMNEYALKYMRDELTARDMANGTFTVTDLSSLGVSFFSPVVNYRQSAILGVCSKDFSGGFFNVILAFDHRLAEGMYAARFLERLEAVAIS